MHDAQQNWSQAKTPEYRELSGSEASRDAGTSVGQGGQKKVEANANLWKTKKYLPVIKPVTRSAQGA